MINYAQAMDEIRRRFYEDWTAKASLIVGYTPEVTFANVGKKETPQSNVYWARFSTQTVTDEQATLSNCEGTPNQFKYTAEGLIFVQLFLPKDDLQANEKGEKLAVIARNAFRKKSTAGGVWFKNARIQEQPQEELFYRFNVVAEYSYDELY